MNNRYFAAGYALTAFLYALAWYNPSVGAGKGLVEWVSFTRLCLAEFLSLHAATLLAAFVLVRQLDQATDEWGVVFWILCGFYLVLAAGAFVFHRSNRALIGFYLLLIIRGGQFLSLATPEADVMRAEVLKNFLMTVPMMFLVGAISMSDDGLRPWQERFWRSETIGQRIWRGKPLLFVSAYYLLWAVVEWKWPMRIAN